MVQIAHACIKGLEEGSNIRGRVNLRQLSRGVLVTAEVTGLPPSGMFALHIHSGKRCSAPGKHFDLAGEPHPCHSGDLPPLFSDRWGWAWLQVRTDRFTLGEVVGRTVIIHARRDDFTTQPSGDPGEMIACGEITVCRG